VTGNHDLPGALQKVVFRLNRRLRAQASVSGLGASDAMLLAAIFKSPGIGVTDLAQEENVGRSVMSERVKRLEAAGLVSRHSASPKADRRRVSLTVTAEGRRKLGQITALRRAWMDERVAHLSSAEREILEAAVAILAGFESI
jgi:DNA-binding MarR family transcriptional regulator